MNTIEQQLQGSGDAFPVHIPEGTDLNKLMVQDTSRFSPEIFNDLPGLLLDACRIINDSFDKEVFLFGSLGIISGILPHVHGVYDGKQYEPNLYCYLIAPFGAGKGFLSNARLLAESIHAEMRETARAEWEAYEAQLAENKKSKKQTQLVKPRKLALYLPANTTKSGLIELLDNNYSRGILFETEGDTLVEALRQDHGGFSDILRKAFHHESIMINRRAADEFRELNEPRLSVVLSSTFDQYRKLIPNIENGLFSRFIHYQIPHSKDFKDVFNPAQNNIVPHLQSLGERFYQNFHHLQKRKARPVVFHLCAAHQERFVKAFDVTKGEFAEYVSSDMAGVINRLGLICFRINMILTVVRHLESGPLPTKLESNETDFDNALRLTAVFRRNALQMFDLLPQNPESVTVRLKEEDLIAKADLIAAARLLFRQGKPYSKIALEVLGDEKLKGTIYRWINS